MNKYNEPTFIIKIIFINLHKNYFSMNSRIRNAITRQFKCIFPDSLNDQDNLFGGIAMKWMDEVAYIAATRYAKKKMVTVSCDKIQFLSPIKSGTIAEIIGKVSKVKNVTIEIQVEIFLEDKYSDERQKVVEASFTFAAVNENNNPIRIENREIVELV